jgi:hypothetical protein
LRFFWSCWEALKKRVGARGEAWWAGELEATEARHDAAGIARLLEGLASLERRWEEELAYFWMWEIQLRHCLTGKLALERDMLVVLRLETSWPLMEEKAVQKFQGLDKIRLYRSMLQVVPKQHTDCQPRKHILDSIEQTKYRQNRNNVNAEKSRELLKS